MSVINATACEPPLVIRMFSGDGVDALIALEFLDEQFRYQAREPWVAPYCSAHSPSRSSATRVASAISAFGRLAGSGKPAKNEILPAELRGSPRCPAPARRARAE